MITRLRNRPGVLRLTRRSKISCTWLGRPRSSLEGSQRRFVLCSYRLRLDSDPKGSIAASAAYIIGKNCLQFFTVDRNLSFHYAPCPGLTTYISSV
ncbi:MAG: hypothetical protein ACREXS_15305 [Gammaproteobacteria bacterium]